MPDFALDHSDEAYTGEVSDSVFSLDYYRNKAREFQGILNEVDASARAAQLAIQANIDPDLTADLSQMLTEYDQKKVMFRTAAEGINAGAALINSAGGRFPQLSIPTGLGLAPLVIPAATIAALAVAASLVTWGAVWISGVNERLRIAQLTGAVTDPVKRDALATALGMAEAANIASNESPLSAISGVVKWGAIALAAFLAYRAFQASR